jgi:hypothetical protein
MAAPAEHARTGAAGLDRCRQVAGRPAEQRLRIGLFAYTDAMTPAPDAAPAPTVSPAKEQ